MVLFRVIIGSIWVSILLIGRAILTPTEFPSPRVSIAVEPRAVLPDAHMDEPWRPNATAEPSLDFLGNPIEAAVGDYRTDSRGDLYERRTPNTTISALPRPEV